jgi:hypothetical protein
MFWLQGEAKRMNHILEIFKLFFNYQFVEDIVTRKSRDSSVGIALGYGLDDRGSGVRFPVGVENFSLHHSVHPVSYSTCTGGSFPGEKAAGA